LAQSRNFVIEIIKMQMSNETQELKLESEEKKFQAKIYIFKGRGFLCPHSQLQPGQVVIGTPDGENVDPLKKYRFVITLDGETESVSKSRLLFVASVKVKWMRKPLTTAMQEMQARMDAAIEEFNKFIKS
jgi:hypothetical protein